MRIHKGMAASLAKLEKLFFVCSILSIVAVVIVGIVVRYTPVTGPLMAWMEEVGRLLLIWVLFMGIAWADRDGSHFRLELFIVRFGSKVRLALSQFFEILMLIWFTEFLISSIKLSVVMSHGKTAVLQWPYLFFVLPLILCSVVILVQSSMRLVLGFKGWSEQ